MTIPVGMVPRGVRRRTTRSQAQDAVLRGIAALHLKAIWSGFLAQSFAFWCTSFFVFIEFVRPQQIYTQLAVIPWGKIALGSAVIFSAIEGRIAFREKVLWILVMLFTAVILASSATAFQPSVSFDNLELWGIWLLAMSVVAGASRSRTEIILTFFLWCLWNFKMSQTAFRSWMLDGFRFRSWGAAGAPGWFTNSGEFGIEMCVFFAVVSYLLVGLWPNLSKARRIAMAAVALSAVVGAVASSSRGALVGLAAIGLWVLLRSRQRLKAIGVVVVLSSVVWFTLPTESKKRWTEAGDDDTSTRRIQYWKDGLKIVSDYPLLGIGYKNWMPYYTIRYNPKGQLPHNIFIECMAELGYTGLLVFTLLIGGTFWQNAQTRKRTNQSARAPDRVVYYMAYGLDGALLGYLASGFFVTVLFYPYFWFNLAFTMAIARYANDRAIGSGSPWRAAAQQRAVALPKAYVSDVK